MDNFESTLDVSLPGDTANKPLLLLDIDGALSPFIEPGEDGAEDLWWITEFEGVAPQLPSWLARLSQYFELVWATSREDEANEIIGPLLGLGPLRVVHFTRGGNDDTAKLSNVMEFVGTKPFAWVDDVFGDDAFYAAQRHVSDALLIHTGELVGITHEHVDQLLAFGQRF